VKNLLSSFGLPVDFPAEKNKLLSAVRKDKKRVKEKINFVFLSEIGKAEIKKISYQELEEQVDDLCESG
jgi:3-dehydroquinate synthetase